MIFQEGKCILCNKRTNKDYWFCKECYHEIVKVSNNYLNWKHTDILKEYKQIQKKYQTDKNLTTNYKYYICNLYALAESIIINFTWKKSAIKYKVNIKFFFAIFSQFLVKETKTNNFNDEDYRNKFPKDHLCDDGHYVRSLSEMIIDNWLYNNNIVHAYEKSVFMKSNPDAIVLSDFYIPKGNVYIEFWGMENDEKYAKRKEIKINLYDENKINRIDLIEKDLKRLDDVLPRYLSKYIK